VKITNYETPHCVIFSIIMLLSRSYMSKFSPRYPIIIIIIIIIFQGIGHLRPVPVQNFSF